MQPLHLVAAAAYPVLESTRELLPRRLSAREEDLSLIGIWPIRTSRLIPGAK
jgi:hypothetical protein